MTEKEIKDITCYLRLVQNKADDLALIRIINEPKRGIGGKDSRETENSCCCQAGKYF